MIQTRMISPGGPDWQKCLERIRHDIYHKSEYVRLCADHEGGEPAAFVAEDGNNLFFVPLLLQKISTGVDTLDGFFDAISPYGYPCPLSSHADDAFVKSALQQMLSTLRARGVVSTFVRFHPLLPSSLDLFQQYGTLVRHGETVYQDLTRPEDELWKDVRRTTRQEINRAKRNGFVAEVDCEWKHIDKFVDIYWEGMQRVKAKDEYFFPREYFQQIKDSLSDLIHLFVIHRDGEIVCAGINSEVGGIVQAHLAGARSEFLDDHLVKLLFDTVRRWAKQRGNRVFHIGGGFGGNEDSLFNFKAAFSKSRAEYHTWRVILNSDVHQALVAQWERRSGAAADGVDGFFPPYRKKLNLNLSPSDHNKGTHRPIPPATAG